MSSEGPFFIALGWSGSVMLYPDWVVLSPETTKRAMPHERILQKGGAVGWAIIPYEDVVGVAVRRASSLTHGAIIVGTSEIPVRDASLVAVVMHPNAIQFRRRMQPAFIEAKRLIDVRCAQLWEAESSGAAAPGWYADPGGRHELRYWDGGQWTEHVSTHGAQTIDPPSRPPQNP